jgi:hypothetical protein
MEVRKLIQGKGVQMNSWRNFLIFFYYEKRADSTKL